ncbi:uncharacterized protein B0T15DRAFT_547244 [Chaetomium strumarium]|uniref:Uncharacterized protein n=1 Tax=Chaetomium strumarium TaxID=1170767 RepID=A0AAJ0H2W7_9PEZI|nr:hypothetical protein B0T15DRAFT_547244 [Chaetomium strumarium]
MKASAVGRAVSHGALCRSPVTEDHTQRTSGNSFVATTVQLKSMFGKTTETEDRSPSAGPSPTGIGYLDFTDGWERLSPSYNRTSGTISPSDSNNLSTATVLPAIEAVSWTYRREATPVPQDKGARVRAHRRKAAVSEIPLSALFDPNLTLSQCSGADPASTQINGQYHIDKGKSDSHLRHHILLEGTDEEELRRTSPRSSTLLSERLSSKSEGHSLPNSEPVVGPGAIESPNRKLRLRVSRSALAKARQQAGAKSRTSFGHRSSGSADDPDRSVIATPSPVPSTTETAPSKQRRGRGGGYLARPSATPESRPSSDLAAIPSEIEALFYATGSRVNGKALLRLKKRFPDLGARLAEMQLQSVEPLAGVAGDDERARQAAFPGEAARHEQSHPLRKKRLRGQISRWMKNARQAVTGGRASKGWRT